MEKIILKKGEGKTRRLISKSAETGHYIVTYNRESVREIEKRAATMQIRIPFPMTYDEFLSKSYYPQGVRGVLIDDVDRLVQYISKVPITAITLTQPE